MDADGNSHARTCDYVRLIMDKTPATFPKVFEVLPKQSVDERGHFVSRSSSFGAAGTKMALSLRTLPGRLMVARLEPSAKAPAWALDDHAPLVSVTRTRAELSVVGPEALPVPEEAVVERGWRALVVEGPLDFALVGILAGLAAALAAAGVSIFALSTYDTDYLLVKEPDLAKAESALRESGYRVSGDENAADTQE